MTGRPSPGDFDAAMHASQGNPSFSLESANGTILAHGAARHVEPGGAATLAQRVASSFAAMTDGPRVLVGALPFDRDSADCLFQPERFSRRRDRPSVLDPARSALPSQGANWIVTPEPTAADYSASVARCLALMQGDPALEKVVLSRSLLVTADKPVDPARLRRHLALDPSVTIFSTDLQVNGSNRVLVGATPELLVAKTDDVVQSHPLAGSARRHASPSEDRRSAATLEASEKDYREHRAVVDAVLDALAPYCADLAMPDGTGLHATATLWHLGTRIVGRLKDRDTPVVELVAALHPTPAVCGLPRERARKVIRDLEGHDRGFYAGAVGWTDAEGDGAWHVSIRCAEIEGARVRLFAGAGIVPGSDPLAEADETSAKFLTLLGALGVDEHGRPLRERAA